MAQMLTFPCHFDSKYIYTRYESITLERFRALTPNNKHAGCNSVTLQTKQISIYIEKLTGNALRLFTNKNNRQQLIK